MIIKFWHCAETKGTVQRQKYRVSFSVFFVSFSRRDRGVEFWMNFFLKRPEIEWCCRRCSIAPSRSTRVRSRSLDWRMTCVETICWKRCPSCDAAPAAFRVNMWIADPYQRWRGFQLRLAVDAGPASSTNRASICSCGSIRLPPFMLTSASKSI